MIKLTDLPLGVFEGVIPTVLGTVSADGMPNATWLSQVFFVDESHVALSCQFFRKTRANLEAHPVAEIMVVDPATLRQWCLAIRFLRSEDSGRTFDAMQTRIQALASSMQAAHSFALRSADVFEVLSISPIDVPAATRFDGPEERAKDTLRVLSRLTETIGSSADLEGLVEGTLTLLEKELGYESLSLYWLEDSEGMLYVLASRGSARSGVGARIAFGAGIVGACAQRRTPLRIANAIREVVYAKAVRERAEGRTTGREREIPLPGLDEALSLLAVPLVVQGKLLGVLAAESRRALAFDERDTQLLSTVGQMLAQGIVLHRDDEPERDDDANAPRPSAPADPLRVRYYEADDSVFIGSEYLIKGLPGRILWLVLTLQKEEGRSTFLNRELRLHPFLKLPSYKDNLETRLLMLQRRLAEKDLPLRLHRAERGRLRLECAHAIELERIGASG